jgi:hypothetical protein
MRRNGMKGLILSATMAAGLGLFAAGSANAAPIATHGVIVAPAVTTDVACRTVKKVVVRNGVRRVTNSRVCNRGPVVRKRVVRRGYGYRAPRPGVRIGIGVR